MIWTAAISLGSNLGDRRAHIREALEALDVCPEVQLAGVSHLYETEPVGGPEEQPSFLNAAAVLRTELEPEALLEKLQTVEQSAGRIRDMKWGPRTLDLDLLLHGDAMRDSPQLRLPHPGLPIRRFVLEPLAEIASPLLEPCTGLTIGALLGRLDRLPRRVGFQGWDSGLAFALSEVLPPSWQAVHLDQLPGHSMNDLLLIYQPDTGNAFPLTQRAVSGSGVPVLKLPVDLDRAANALRALCVSVMGRVLRLEDSAR